MLNPKEDSVAKLIRNHNENHNAIVTTEDGD
jgi:hypothetical protein